MARDIFVSAKNIKALKNPHQEHPVRVNTQVVSLLFFTSPEKPQRKPANKIQTLMPNAAAHIALRVLAMSATYIRM